MRSRSKIVKAITQLTIVAFLLPISGAAQVDQPDRRSIDPISESNVAYRYRLFETTNMWTFILLDTTNGKAWQVQYSVDDSPAGRMIINSRSLLPDGATEKNGRFILYPTQNMYSFMLLDRQDGRIWQLQWSLESDYRGIMRSID